MAKWLIFAAMLISMLLLGGVNVPRVLLFAGVVLGLAYLVGRRNKAQGLPFWRTFIMATIGLTGLGFLLVNLFGYLME